MKRDRIIYWLHILHDIFQGKRSNSYYILGYPRSGTNWLTTLISDYTDIPVSEPWKLSFPRFRPYIFHVHRFIKIRSVRERTIYIVRDGRDIMVSYYFMLTRDPLKMRIKDAAERFMKNEITNENIKTNLSGFILFLKENKISSIDYKSHVMQAINDGYLMIKYEDLLQNSAEVLADSLEKLLNEPIDKQKIETICQKQSFKERSGRDPGMEDNSAFMRKGIKGDWVNYFTKESAEVFLHYAGDLLIKTGYENDHNWAEQFH